MFEKEIWIAKRKSIETNENGIDVEIFEAPKKYYLNYQPISGYLDLQQYGEDINNIYRIFVNRNSFQGVINVGDRAYLNDGLTSEKDLREIVESDNKYCEKANFKVSLVLPQNLKIRIDLIKI